MNTAGITVTIDGDASGLTGAVAEATAAVNELRELTASLGAEDLSIDINAQDNASAVIGGVAAAVSEVPQTRDTALNAIDNASAAARSVASAINAIPSSKTVTINIVTKGSVPKIATGCRDFEGGAALINDERGVSDPRELIVHDGYAYMYEGKNVIAPIPKHARVYTASQTKAILRGLPSFASGYVDNSANDELWDLYLRLSQSYVGDGRLGMEDARRVFGAVDFSGAAPENYEGILRAAFESETEYLAKLEKEREERVREAEKAAASTGKNAPKYYDPTGAFIDRAQLPSVRLEDMEDAVSGCVDLAEKERDYDAVSEYTIELLDRKRERVAALESANADLRNQLEYLMTSSGYENIADWIDEYGNATETYYELVNSLSTSYEQEAAKGYLNDISKIQKRIADNAKEIRGVTNDVSLTLRDLSSYKVEAWQRDFDAWRDMRDTYGDWEDFGDSESQYYARAMMKQKEFFDEGSIGWQDYHDSVLEYALDMYRAASDEYDAELEKQRDYISDLRERFSEEEQRLQDSWAAADREADLDEINRLLDVYENASTDEGRQKYKDLLEQKKELERGERLCKLQEKNNAAIETLEDEYSLMESGKKETLSSLKISGRSIASGTFDIAGAADGIAGASEEIRGDIEDIGFEYGIVSESALSALDKIYEVLQGIRRVVGGGKNVYNDSRTIHVATAGMTENSVRGIVNGTIISGLADYIY